MYKIVSVKTFFSNNHPFIQKMVVQIDVLNNGLCQTETYERIIDGSKSTIHDDLPEKHVFYYKNVDGFTYKTSAENAASIFAQADFMGDTE